MLWLLLLLGGLLMSTTMGAGTVISSTDESVTVGDFTVNGDLSVTGAMSVAGTFTGSFGRSATYVIAASDAPAHVIAQADYKTTDYASDDLAIQAAINAIEAQTRATGSIKLFGGFTCSGALTFTLNNLDGPITVDASDAWIDYSGAATAVNVLTNIAATLLKPERHLDWRGGVIRRTGLATGGIWLNASKCSFRDIVFLDFTGTTDGNGAITLFADYTASPLTMAEENTFDNISIWNGGNGICFRSGSDSSSFASNSFKNISIGADGAAAIGIYVSGTATPFLVRCSFDTIDIHLLNQASATWIAAHTQGTTWTSVSAEIHDATACEGFGFGAGAVMDARGVFLAANSGSFSWTFAGGGVFRLKGEDYENTATATANNSIQTIAHGLATTPTSVWFSFPTYDEPTNTAWEYATADTTNIYVASIGTGTFRWHAEV